MNEICIKLHQSSFLSNKLYGAGTINRQICYTNNTTNTKSLMYKVHIIDSNGKANEEAQLMSYSDILKDSSIHVRDLFSLSLTALADEGKDKRRNTLRGNRISR